MTEQDKPQPLDGQQQLAGSAKPAVEEDDLLSRSDILDADDAKYDEVAVPEWSKPGGKIKKVRLRTLTVRERTSWEQSVTGGKAGANQTVNMQSARERLIMLTAVDRNGDKLFPSSADLAALGDKAAAAMERIFEASLKLSGIGPDAVEEMAKNSDATPSDNGSSVLP